MSRTGLQAACPQCGGPLHFGGARSLVAVCPHCRSAIARSDVALENIGRVPDLVATDSRLSLGVSGRVGTSTFTVLGRVRLHEGRASWDEWYVTWSDGTYGWLAEAQGRLIITRRAEDTTIGPMIAFDTLQPGMRVHIEGVGLATIEQVGQATLQSAEGELPFTPHFGATYRFADASLEGDGYATLDWGTADDESAVYAGYELAYEDANIPELHPGLRANEASGEALACPNCGAPLSLRAADSKSVVCPSCRGLCDVQHGRLALIAVLHERKPPALPLGAAGKLFGKQLEVIGWLQRGCTYDGVDYRWDEYLLHGPAGYRWLTESHGHWTYLEPMPAARATLHGSRSLRIQGRRYSHFSQSVDVRYEAIQGEFYWQIQPYARVQTDDYVSPPYIASREVEEHEIVWTRGEYLPAAELWSAFGLPGKPPRPSGVAPAQPNPHRPRVKELLKVGALTAIGLLVLAALVGFVLPRRQVQSLVVPVGRDVQVSLSEPFVIEGSTHADEIEVALTTPWAMLPGPWGAKPWVGLAVSLIDEASGHADTVQLELWQDEDGEQRVAHEKIGSISPGRYVLRAEAVTASGTPPEARGEVLVTVRHGVFLWFPLVVGFGLLLLPSLFVAIRSGMFEHQRWSKSDYGSSD